MKTILHSDLNNFFASVECLFNPSIRDKPVAVCGNPEARHGIILAKNNLAKKAGVLTAEAIWQAKDKCPNLILVSPSYDRYIRFSNLALNIYKKYTDLIFPFGIDEAWLDVSSSSTLFGGGEEIANKIREEIKFQLGITASVGVSYNKIFAKLASDMKKPDATTVITKDNFKEKVWPLPVSDLLYVGSSTKNKLNLYSIDTIGKLALADSFLLKTLLGKNGLMLKNFANGIEITEEVFFLTETSIKSIGNSTTSPRDLVSDEDVTMVLYILCESVASRMRDHNFACQAVQITIRDKNLRTIQRQGPLEIPSQNSYMLFDKAFSLYKENHNNIPIRSLGVRAIKLFSQGLVQVSFLKEYQRNEKRLDLESTIDKLRARFGHDILSRAILLKEKNLSQLNIKDNSFGGRVDIHE